MGCLRSMVWLVGIIFIVGVAATFFRSSPTPPTSSVPTSVLAETPSAPAVPADEQNSAPTKPLNDPTPPSPWRLHSEVSKLDDSTNVWLSVDSSNLIDKRFGGVGRATLTIRCMENTTAVILQFADHFMADLQGYGQVTYRIDKQTARKREFRESTDNSMLGLWNGGTAIPFVKALFEGENLYVQAVPFNEAPVTGEFKISRLEVSIEPLRKACNW